MAWARRFSQPTLYVAGNHEFYGSALVSTMAALRTEAQGSPVRVLEREEWRHGGVRFLACTLWSDYRLFDSPAQREEGLQKAQAFVRDFSRIGLTPDFPDRFTPAGDGPSRGGPPRLWLHGHVHHSCDYQVGATRVVANPRGYAPKGVVENAQFAPGLLIEV